MEGENQICSCCICNESQRGTQGKNWPAWKKPLCPVKRKRKKTPTQTLARICAPHTENTFLVSRKDSYGVHASGCPMTGRLTCWISTREFVKVITSIISLPWQPHNTHSGFNESPSQTDQGLPWKAGALSQSPAAPREAWWAKLPLLSQILAWMPALWIWSNVTEWLQLLCVYSRTPTDG